MMTKEQWIERIKDDAFAKHVYEAIVSASTTTEKQEQDDNLASALQTYEYVRK